MEAAQQGEHKQEFTRLVFQKEPLLSQADARRPIVHTYHHDQAVVGSACDFANDIKIEQVALLSALTTGVLMLTKAHATDYDSKMHATRM